MTNIENPRDVFSRRAAYYTSSPAHAEKSADFPRTDAQVLAKVVRLAEPQPHWRALDVGTGTGHSAFALAPRVASVVGLDVTPEMLAEAEKLRAGKGLGSVRFCLGDAHHLPFASASFDLVTCRRAAHHFAHLTAALGEMRRVLQPGARLVIDDRSVPEDDFVEACMNELDHYHDHSHVYAYRPGAWEATLHQAGFHLHRTEPYSQHRPLTSLTEGVAAEDVARIHAVLGRLDADHRQCLNLVELDGQLWINHWYVLVKADAA